MTRSSRLLSRPLRFLGWCFAGFYLLFLLTPYLPPTLVWIFDLFQPAFPILLLLLLFCLLVSFVGRNTLTWVFVILVLLSIPLLRSSFAMHPSSRNKVFIPERNTFRILTWNVSHWGMSFNNLDNDEYNRANIISWIKEQKADVVCLQEFFQDTKANKNNPQDNIALMEYAGYPFYSFQPADSVFHGARVFGVAIFSKYPLKETNFYPFDPDANGEGILSAVVNLSGRRVRIFTTHLESARLNSKTPRPLRQYENGDGSLGQLRMYGMKMHYAYKHRQRQAEMLRTLLDMQQDPVIVCGDFNDLPISWSYRKIRGDLNDVFLKKGSGWGATYRYRLPTLRIDYILADPALAVEHTLKGKNTGSEHYPLLTDLKWK